MTEMERPWTVREAADLFRVSTWTVASWTRTGLLARVPGIRPIRIPAHAIRALLEDYDGGHGQSVREASPKAATSWRRNRGAAQGSLEKAPMGGRDSLARPIGPKAGDVVVRVVEGRSR